MVPVEAVRALARADVPRYVLRFGLALLDAAETCKRMSVSAIGAAIGLGERLCRLALARLLGDGGVLTPWVERSVRDGRSPSWSLRGIRSDRIGEIPPDRIGEIRSEAPYASTRGEGGVLAGVLSSPCSEVDPPPQPHGEGEGERLPLVEVPDEHRASAERLAEAGMGWTAPCEGDPMVLRPAGRSRWVRAVYSLAVGIGGGSPAWEDAALLLARASRAKSWGSEGQGWWFWLQRRPEVALRMSFLARMRKAHQLSNRGHRTVESMMADYIGRPEEPVVAEDDVVTRRVREAIRTSCPPEVAALAESLEVDCAYSPVAIVVDDSLTASGVEDALSEFLDHLLPGFQLVVRSRSRSAA